jgi:hypothetical protein
MKRTMLLSPGGSVTSHNLFHRGRVECALAFRAPIDAEWIEQSYPSGPQVAGSTPEEVTSKGIKRNWSGVEVTCREVRRGSHGSATGRAPPCTKRQGSLFAVTPHHTPRHGCITTDGNEWR